MGNLKKLLVHPESCTGCKSCMLICSFVHTDSFGYKRARLHVMKREERAESTPVICRHCEDAPCIGACPESAISSEPGGGRVQLNEDLCSGCRVCLAACPYDAIFFDEERGVAFKCDLCGGDPECVKVCMLPQALQYGEVT